MINPNEHRDHIEMMLKDIEDNAGKYTMAINALQRALIAARRICENMIRDQAILNKQGKEYFEATLPIEQKPIKIEGVKPKTDNIKKPR